MAPFPSGLPGSHSSTKGGQEAWSPGFIKRGNIESLDVNVGVQLRENDSLATLSHLVHVPHHHHLQRANAEPQLHLPALPDLH